MFNVVADQFFTDVDAYNKTNERRKTLLSKTFSALLFVTTVVTSFFENTMVAEAQFVTNGLVGRWTFDGIVQGKLKDVFGSNDGAVKGNPRLVEGQIGSAMRFTGTDRVEIFSAKELVLKDYTLDVWIKADEEPHDRKNSRILAKGVGGANYALTWSHADDWKKFSQSVSSQMTGGFFISSSTRKNPLNGGEWYNIVGSYNAKHMKIYVNTELRNSKTWAGTPITDPSELVIGAMVGGVEGFEGVIDELKIYNRVLTDAEIIKNHEVAKAMPVEYANEKLALSWGELKTSR